MRDRDSIAEAIYERWRQLWIKRLSIGLSMSPHWVEHNTDMRG